MTVKNKFQNDPEADTTEDNTEAQPRIWTEKNLKIETDRGAVQVTAYDNNDRMMVQILNKKNEIQAKIRLTGEEVASLVNGVDELMSFTGQFEEVSG